MMERRAAFVLSCSVALAACGGGANAPARPQAPGVTPAPASTGAAATAAQRGSVLDADNANAPVTGATVRAGTTFAGGSLGGVAGVATTATDGTFAFGALAPAAIYVQVDAPGYISSHRVLASLTAAPILLTRPAAAELAALAQMNADRAAFGSGAGTSAVALDADAEIVARHRAAEMAGGGWFSHTEPGTNQAANAIEWCAIGGFCGRGYADAESIAEAPAGSTFATAEAAYIAEGPSGAHFQAITNAADVWAGFGAAYGGVAATAGLPDYFTTQEIQALPGTAR